MQTTENEYAAHEGNEGESRSSRIVIVGGGAAGLAAAGALKKLGFDAVVIEKDAEVGGTWARRYDRLHLHTIRALSGLPHLPIPRRFNRYVARDQYVQYLQRYVQAMKLNVVTGCAVKSIRALEGGEDAEGNLWRVETDMGVWKCRVVILATGQYSVPQIPNWPGIEEYRGCVMHSAEYANGIKWAERRALVVGVGNSGAEIATDLADSGASLAAISIRTAPFMTRRDTLGIPVQALSFVMSSLPPKAADRLASAVMRLAFGDMREYGIERPGYAPYSGRRVPVIDVGFAKAVKQGRVEVRPGIVGFTPTGVKFSDGREEAFDVVISATGFTSGLADLLDVPGVLTEEGYPRFDAGEPTSERGLYFIGFTHSLRGHLYEANRASRRLARNVAAFLKGSSK